MGRYVAIALLLVGVTLGLGGCLLSPQPEPPDIVDPAYPSGFGPVEPAPGGESDGGMCDDGTTGLDGCYSDGETPPCGCEGARDCGCDEDPSCGCPDGNEPGDCGHDEPGPTEAERGRFYLSPDDIAASSDEDDPDDPVAASL